MPIKILLVMVAMLASVIAKCQIRDFKYDGFQGAIFPKNEVMTIDDSTSITRISSWSNEI